MPGSFTCDCQKGFKRDGDKCVKKKVKKKTDKGKKTVEEELADVLKKGDYSEMQMKFGSVLFALFFACAVAAVMKRSLLAIVVMTVVYAFIWWYFRT